ncbi:MAG TPA: GspH/FimT family pseudopilin [Rhodanobacteraceae bacterium]|nr:GspH/FimT family pseudopilin [Rhodanobacteraceae bacterium]
MSLARTRGFTLVELMITITVAAILAAIALPSFRDFLRRNAVTAQANQVLASLQYARNEAVSRRYPTAVCASTAGTGCDGGSTFENGWMVWRDSTLGGTPAYNGSPPDELLRVTQAQSGVSIRSFGGTGAGLIAFDQRGQVIGATGVTNIVICAKSKSSDAIGTSTSTVTGQYVRIDSSGRITVQSLTAGSNCNAAPT